MELNRPYFLTNEEWFVYDLTLGQYKLTKEATPKAKQSFIDYYGLWEDLALEKETKETEKIF